MIRKMMMMKMMMMIPAYWICVSLRQSLVLAQDPGEQCFTRFTKGKENFVLDTDESVKNGAEFVASPHVTGAKDCLSACCKEPRCNLALMENGAQEGTIKSCFLFNCLYKQTKVCSFVSKKGFSDYMLTSVLSSYLKEYDPNNKDRPPRAAAGQDRVVQPRESVILTGIESKDDNKLDQFEWVQVSGSPTAVMEKTNFPDEVRVSNLSAGVYEFRLTVTDTAGQSDSAVVKILVLTPEQSHHHCLVPKKIGPCRGSFPRWHYNALTEQCEKFTFGGCNPNRNNYLSVNECSQACDQVSVHSVTSPGRHGPIERPIEECEVPCGAEKFTCANGCCIDKELECDQVKQCSDGSDEEQCANLDSKFRRLLDINEDTAHADSARHCTQPPAPGSCRDSTTKWYYNPYNLKCFRFNYGGCSGNGNRFDSEEECLTVCSKVTERDAFDSKSAFEKQTQDEHSVFVAVAVSMGLVILILLAVLGYCFLKEKKRKHPRHQHISANGAHLLPIQDTEKLVYNSTTKPI